MLDVNALIALLEPAADDPRSTLVILEYAADIDPSPADLDLHYMLLKLGAELLAPGVYLMPGARPGMQTLLNHILADDAIKSPDAAVFIRHAIAILVSDVSILGEVPLSSTAATPWPSVQRLRV